MSKVTAPSIAYVATQVRNCTTGLTYRTVTIRFQVRFALSSASVFCKTDRETDSETFYQSVLELLEDPEEMAEVKDLLNWWNR